MNKEYIYAWARYLYRRAGRALLRTIEVVVTLFLMALLSILIALSITLDVLDGGYREGKLI